MSDLSPTSQCPLQGFVRRPGRSTEVFDFVASQHGRQNVVIAERIGHRRWRTEAKTRRLVDDVEVGFTECRERYDRGELYGDQVDPGVFSFIPNLDKISSQFLC